MKNYEIVAWNQRIQKENTMIFAVLERKNKNAQAKRGQEAISENNFGYLLETIANPDEVSSKKDEKSGVLSLTFIKEIGGKTTAITIFSEKRKTLTLKTAWITKKEQHISQPTNAEALIRTPEARSSMNAVLNSSISQPSKVVNPESEKSDVRFSRSAQDSTDSAAQKGYHESTEQTVDEKISEKMKHSSKAVSELYANWKQNAGQGYPENSISQRGIIYQDGRKPPQGSLALKKALQCSAFFL